MKINGMIEEEKQADISSVADFTKRFINQTEQSVFLTGKAGTGKTTLLKTIIATTHKNAVVVAPTGIAALNAGGVTIHSFFQIPFGAFLPDYGTPPSFGQRTKFNTKTTLQKNHFKTNKTRLEMIRKLELLIIDEVSMLRADLLDAIDFKLQKIRRNSLPYGGVQLLFIGDLLQLPPIVKREEEYELSKYYKGYYFFHAQVIKECPPLYIELDKIYRQNDKQFIQLLNELRNNKISDKNIQLLNQYVHPDFDAKTKEGIITLTTHNKKADDMNKKALESLSGHLHNYPAQITKKFPESIYPISKNLELKKGAQVMFIKNDPSPEKRFFNGKIGTVKTLSAQEITVSFPEENKTIKVEPYEWENVKFSLDEMSGEIVEKVIGTFVQYPLKLAWAITVHKSQGLTFEKAVLDLSGVFAPGQAYVGLSRLTSLKGLILKSPIRMNGLRNDQEVVNYAKNRLPSQQLADQLETYRIEYLRKRLQITFNWDAMVSHWFVLENQHKLGGKTSIMGKNRVEFEKYTAILADTLEPSRKFRNQLVKLCNPQNFNRDLLLERCAAAHDYFMKKLEDILLWNIRQIILLSRQKGVKQYVDELKQLDEGLSETILSIKRSLNLLKRYVSEKEWSKSTIWTEEIKNYRAVKVQQVKENLRRTNPTIGEIDSAVVFKSKSKKKTKKKKESTFEKTFKLFEKGYSIQEIADRRVLKEETIFNHLGRLIKEEKVDIEEVLPSDKLDYLKEVLGNEISGSLTAAKNAVGKKISWGELGVYRDSLLK